MLTGLGGATARAPLFIWVRAMGDVVELMPRIRQRMYRQWWDEVLDGKPGALARVRTLIAIDPDFRAFCEAEYRALVANRQAAQDDGA